MDIENKQFSKIVILTGAGISAESGIRTFRDSNGLWEGHDIMEVAHPSGWAKNPDLVQHFYNLRRARLKEVSENAAHKALGKLEAEWKGEFLLVTQNVDDLHERGGSQNIVHMHGELLKKRNTQTGEVQNCKEDLKGNDWRPHIVWFDEIPFDQNKIQKALESCDCFISIGTSGVVYPAAGMASVAKSLGAATIIINLNDEAHASIYDKKFIGPATEQVPQMVDWLLQRQAQVQRAI
jgi:NAD-dependent deacetylase